MPSVNALYDRYKARGFEVRLVAFRESPELVRRTVKERGYSAPVLLDRSGDTTGRVYGVFGPPTVYLIDRKGTVLARQWGPAGWNSPGARKLIAELVEQK